MTVYTIVNATVIRRRRDPEDVAAAAAKKRQHRRKRPAVADQVTNEFRALNKLGRATGSTR